MRPAYQLPQGAMHAMPAMPVAGAHGHVSSPHVVMRAPLPGYGSPTAQMHQAAGMESFMRILLVDCLNIWSNLCYYYVIITYCLLLLLCIFPIIMLLLSIIAYCFSYCIGICFVMWCHEIWSDGMRCDVCMHGLTVYFMTWLKQPKYVFVCAKPQDTTRKNVLVGILVYTFHSYRKVESTI